MGVSTFIIKRRGSTAELTLNIGTGAGDWCPGSGHFTPGEQLSRRMGGLHSRSGYYEEKNFCLVVQPMAQ